MDWDNIKHVTAIAKALQEKHNMLRRKTEGLEKEQEEVCVANYKIGPLGVD